MNFLRTNGKKIAVVATFALVIAGSGLASLASLSDVLVDTVEFNALSVDISANGADSASISFDNIDPTITTSFSQDLDLANSGSASATVSVTSEVTVGEGTDLDAAITVAAFDGTCAAPGARISTPGAWTNISALGVTPFQINSGAHKAVCLQFALQGNPSIAASAVAAEITFAAVHP